MWDKRAANKKEQAFGTCLASTWLNNSSGRMSWWAVGAGGSAAARVEGRGEGTEGTAESAIPGNGQAKRVGLGAPCCRSRIGVVSALCFS